MAGAGENRFFDGATLALVRDPCRWRLVSTLLPPGPETAPDRRPPGRGRVPVHAHQYPEILLALEGTTPYGVDGRVVRCTPGTVLFLDDNVPHDFGYPPGPAAFRHVWIRIVQDHVFVELHVHGGTVVDAMAWGCLFPLAETGVDFWRLLADCHGGRSATCLRLRLQTAFGGILARLIEEGTHEPSAPPDVLAQAIETVRAHMDETGGLDASLDELARLAGYSKFYFWRAFKRRVGVSLHEYVDRCRIRKVSAWLAEGRSQKEIGRRLGFSCLASFSRWCGKYREPIAAARRSERKRLQG